MALKALKDGRPAKLTIPKSLGACVDLYRELRDKRLEVQKIAEAWEEQEKALQKHLIDNISKSTQSTGVVGKQYKALVVPGTSYKIADDKAFYDHVAKTKSFDLLQRRLNEKAVADRMADPKKKIPGIGTFDYVKLSVTKI